MIDHTKGPLPQTIPEPQGAAAGVRQKPTASFQAVLTNSNGETFELPPAWGSYKPEPKAAAAPPPPPPAAAAEPQVASIDDSWRDGQVASAPATAPAPAAPAKKAAPVTTTFASNGEVAFEPPSAADAASFAGNKGNVSAFAEGNEPTVWDLIDFINPLQHIPVINLVYRELTGDKIGALPQIVGGAVIGGPIGGISAIANVIVQETTGKDLGGHVMAMLSGETEAAPVPETKFAETAPAPTPTAAPAEAPKPQGSIEVMAPTPAAARTTAAPTTTAGNFVPYSQAPAHQLPDAQAAAAKGKSAGFKPVPQRTNPTAPVSASALAKPSPESLKRAAAQAAPPMVNPNPTGQEEALSAPTPVTSRRAISAGDSANPQANPANSGDFVAKFMSAMDQYDKASRLASAPPPAKKRTE